MRFHKKEVETAFLFYDAAYEKIPELSDIKKEKIADPQAEILKDDSCFLGKKCIKSFGELKEEKTPLYDKSPIALARDSKNSLTVHDAGGKEKHGIGSPEQIEKVPKQASQKTF